MIFFFVHSIAAPSLHSWPYPRALPYQNPYPRFPSVMVCNPIRTPQWLCTPSIITLHPSLLHQLALSHLPYSTLLYYAVLYTPVSLSGSAPAVMYSDTKIHVQIRKLEYCKVILSSQKTRNPSQAWTTETLVVWAWFGQCHTTYSWSLIGINKTPPPPRLLPASLPPPSSLPLLPPLPAWQSGNTYSLVWR